MIGKLFIVATVAAAGLAVWQSGVLEGARGRKARDDLKAAFRRFPIPHLVLHLPTSLEEMQGLDDTLCECAAPVLEHGVQEQLNDMPTVVDCAASYLFPEIDWPPVHSDHPSIHQYWAILEHRYRQLVLSGELSRFCASPQPTPNADVVPP